MNKLRCILMPAVCAFVFLANSALGDEPETNATIRMALDLSDGSYVIGVPEISSVSLQTSYAKMDIPLKQILSIRIEDNHETASVDLQNGDKVKGVISLEPIRLETVLGKVVIGIEHIKQIDVVLAGGVLPEELKRGLVLHYSFDRDEDGKVSDESGKKNNGKVYGAQWTAEGRIGAACSFNGRDDYISCPNAGLKSLQNHSVCFWAYRTGNGNEWPRFFMNGVVNTAITITQLDSSRDILYRIAGDEDLTTKTLPLVDNEWVHIVCTYDRSVRKIYKNGVKIAEKPGSVRIVDGEGSLAYVGGSEHIAPSSFAGRLDDVMVFDRALSENQVKQMYDLQKQRK